MRTQNARRSAVLVTIGLATVLAVWLWYEVRMYKRSSQTLQCQANLKQLGLAILNYCDFSGFFPSPQQEGGGGVFLHSWRVAILPYLGAETLFARYDYSRPWDSEVNAAVARDVQPYFLMNCPLCERDLPSIFTDYVAVVGPETVFGNGTARRITEDYRSANPDKIIVCEFNSSGITWTEPRDVTIEQVLERYCSVTQDDVCRHYYNDMTVVHVLRLDGAVERLVLPVNRTDLALRLRY